MFINTSNSIASAISVSDMVRLISQLFASEPSLNDVWVTGEISSWVKASSGHAYFSIKDDKSTINCVMWRGSLAKVHGVNLAMGTQINCRGSVELYGANGKMQLNVDTIMPAGEGAIYAEFLRVKAVLEEEGLFAQERKRPIPAFPNNIGVVTSVSGAALQDIINTISRRNPMAKLWLAHSLVQGTDAPANLVSALDIMINSRLPEVIIVARGGGSMEDLSAFNDEGVARAIAASPIPVITGVGHETDTTIVDFVSDLRAPTPTAAAERATTITIDDLISNLEYYNQTIQSKLVGSIVDKKNRLATISQHLRLLSPNRKLNNEIQRLDILAGALEKTTQLKLDQKKLALSGFEKQLAALNPTAVLKRGYAIVQKKPSGVVLKEAESTRAGDMLDVMLYRGKLEVRVENLEQEPLHD